MKGFTFTQLATILFILIGLVSIIVIVVIMVGQFGDQNTTFSGEMNEQIGNLEQSFNECKSLGGTCFVGGCSGKITLAGDNLCETNEVCCI